MNRPVNLALRPVLACLPAWFRFAQCLRRYRDTREAFPHLANAGKYASTFFVVLFSTLFNVYRGASAMVVSLGKATLCFISQLCVVLSNGQKCVMRPVGGEGRNSLLSQLFCGSQMSLLCLSGISLSLEIHAKLFSFFTPTHGFHSAALNCRNILSI